MQLIFANKDLKVEYSYHFFTLDTKERNIIMMLDWVKEKNVQ